MDELEILEPSSKTVKVGGEEIKVPEMNVRQMKSLIKKIGEIMPFIKDNDIDVKAMIIDNPDLLIEIVSICIEKPLDWIDEIKIDELLELALTCVEVNTDFFVNRVLPIFSSMLGRLSRKLDGLNSTSPSGVMGSEAS